MELKTLRLSISEMALYSYMVYLKQKKSKMRRIS